MLPMPGPLPVCVAELLSGLCFFSFGCCCLRLPRSATHPPPPPLTVHGYAPTPHPLPGMATPPTPIPYRAWGWGVWPLLLTAFPQGGLGFSATLFSVSETPRGLGRRVDAPTHSLRERLFFPQNRVSQQLFLQLSSDLVSNWFTYLL